MIITRNAARGLALALLVLGAATGSAVGQGKAPAPDFLVTKRSAHEFAETLNLLRQAIEAENLMVVQEVNPQKMLRMVGVKVGGMRQLYFFHPRYMKQILETNRNAGIEPPLKLLVMEAPDGRVLVRYEKPQHQFGPYDGLTEFAAEMAGIFDRVVGSVTE